MEPIRRFAARLISSADEIVFIVIFVVFIKAAVDWILELMRLSG